MKIDCILSLRFKLSRYELPYIRENRRIEVEEVVSEHYMYNTCNVPSYDLKMTSD